jgi:cell division protein FtsZ
MVVMLEFDKTKTVITNIKVIGIGGSGGDIINGIIEHGLVGVDFIAIGALEDKDKLQSVVKGADLVFIITELGYGTGTGVSPLIAELAKDSGALVIAVVAVPFESEDKMRSIQSKNGIKELKNHVDSLLTLPSQEIIDAFDEDIPPFFAYSPVSSVIYQFILAISDLIINTGYIVVDFNDVKTIMSGAGDVHFGIGLASGENRAVRAAQKAISSPLLEEIDIKDAKGLLVSITGGSDMSLYEVNEASSLIHSSVNPDACVIWGMVIDESLDDKIKVAVITTGFKDMNYL